MTSDPLQIDDVTKMRGPLKVLDKVGLRVRAGERVALLGHNGAGKSTLIKAVLGLISVDAGTIRAAGAAPGSAQARRATAFLPEAVSFHAALTGREQLRLFDALTGAKSDLSALLTRVGLGDAMDRRIGTYSKGMRQRLGLAQVLLGRPAVALLDEPTSGLDPVSRHDLYEIIDEMAAGGTAVLIASHALTELEARTDRIAILRAGCLVADDTLTKLTDAARLPIRIRVRAPDHADTIAARIDGTRVNGATVEVVCTRAQKLSRLRQITGLGASVEDIDIVPPSLEDLYRHYSRSPS